MKLILGFLIMFSSQMALANDFAAVLGLRSNSAEHDSSLVSVGSKTSFGAGVLGFFDISESLQFRSGFIYNQKNYTTKVGVTDTDYNLAYADIPVTLMYKFADYGGAFIGPVLSLLASKDCSNSAGVCFGKNPTSVVVPVQFGVSFKFAPQLGAELYYELISGDLWENGLKNSKTVGANFLVTFE